MKTYLLLTMVFLLGTGCAMNREVVLLEDRVLKLERNVKEQVQDQDTVQSSEEDIRSKIAEMRLDMNQLHETVNIMNGRFEEADFLSKNQNTSDQAVVQETRQAKETIDEMLTRIAKIEQYLGFENSGTAPPVLAPVDAGAPPQEGKKQTEKEIYAAAKSELDKGNTEAAREGFQAYLKKYPKSDNADNAQFWMGEIYYREKWYEKAILEYQKVIDKFPKGNKVPAAYLKQGYAFENMGEAANARLLLKELIDKFPDSNEAKIAAEKIKELN